MSRNVLVLNADFTPLKLTPLQVVSWKDAMSLVVCGKAVVVEEVEGEVIRTPSKEFKMPSVIALKNYAFFEKFAKFNKRNVKIRDKCVCQYCNTRYSMRALTVDHVKPKSKGGKNSWENLVAACKTCNQKKKNRNEMKPLKQGYKPSYFELARNLYELERTLGSMNPVWVKYVKSVIDAD